MRLASLRPPPTFSALLPGLGLCAAIAALANLMFRLEVTVLGHPFVEALVLAILLGIAVRAVWEPGPQWRAGIAFSARTLLEVAVFLLGASVSLGALLRSGPALLVGILGTVAAALALSYGIGRMLGLSKRVAVLIACGNSICGNSAIAAVAPVIGATNDEIASSISFTALLGVGMVLGLPLLVPLVGLSAAQYGVVAGLTVYAVPQVLAATEPLGLVSIQIGTLVKLTRVLALGPMVLLLSLGRARFRDVGDGPAPRPGLRQAVPWFIVGFLALAAMRSAGLIPQMLLPALWLASSVLTVIAMAALGLGVDLRVVSRLGGRTSAAVVLSLLVLLAISLALVRVLALPADLGAR